MARVLANALPAALGQNVFIENKPGAGNTIGSRQAAAADPDGYTLMVSAASGLIMSPMIVTNAGYDASSFAPVALVAETPQVLVINPGSAKVAQSIETHIEAYGPGAFGQKHGHLNSAVFFVLQGHGHDIHDGRRIDWKAGDIMIVETGCVHQHFNDDPEEQAVLLVFKAKPLFLFMHLLFQKMVEYPPTTLLEGHEDWQPPSDL